MARYVASDIHGHLDYLEDILRQIKFSKDDTLYIIGDAIDRGPNPIGVLKKIMSMSNVVFLLGNHEHMMLQALKEKDSVVMSSWMQNGGDITLEQFEMLPQKEQDEILDFLNNSYIAIPNVETEDRNYFLAHASHPLFFLTEPLKYSDAKEFDKLQILWSRDYEYIFPKDLADKYSRLYAAYNNTTLIFGHTPVYKTNYGRFNKNGQPLISRTGKGHLINIDCGCARGLPLGCLRLEDGKEFYAKLSKGTKISFIKKS